MESNYTVVDENGNFLATPYEFHVFPDNAMPVGFMKYADMVPTNGQLTPCTG